MTRTRAQAGLWVGLGLVAAGQTLGPTAGFWYTGEPARFTWHRLALSLAAFGVAAYPLCAYSGRLDHYNGDLAGGLLAGAITLEAAAILLAAWDLSELLEAVERHNNRPQLPPPRRGRLAKGAALALVPVALPGGGVGLLGRIR